MAPFRCLFYRKKGKEKKYIPVIKLRHCTFQDRPTVGIELLLVVSVGYFTSELKQPTILIEMITASHGIKSQAVNSAIGFVPCFHLRPIVLPDLVEPLLFPFSHKMKSVNEYFACFCCCYTWGWKNVAVYSSTGTRVIHVLSSTYLTAEPFCRLRRRTPFRARLPRWPHLMNVVHYFVKHDPTYAFL